MTAPLIDDRTGPALRSARGTDWALISDGVMGGLSSGRLTAEPVAGRPALHLTGQVSLENDGGFLQMALDLAPGGGPVDASGFAGVELDVAGPPETYGLHLRTAELTRPWQSYRADFAVTPEWTRLRLPFAALRPHRTEVPFAPARLRRLGLIAIGREFRADLAVARVAFFAA